MAENDFTTDFFGLKYPGKFNNFIDWSVYFYGAYEKGILLLMKDLIKNRQDSVFIDVGANVGQHSLFMSTVCAEIHAFEPYKKMSDFLLAKILVNNCSNIFIHHVGLGARNELLDYYAPVGHNTGTGSFIEEHGQNNNIKVGKLEIVQGDFIISQLKLKRIDLIKIDVEGFEKYVLIGLQNSIEKYRPYIVMEYSDSTKENLTINELKAIMPSGYKIKIINTNRKCCFLFNRANYCLSEINQSYLTIAKTVDLLLLPG
jgi:FkbM family methyltransferase